MKAAVLAVVALGAVLSTSDPATAAGPYSRFRYRTMLKPGDTVTLNPQPLPPRTSPWVFNPGGKVSLNPQPLPPRTFMYRNFRR